MRVAVSVVVAQVNAELNPRFGRTAAFVVVDTGTGQCEVLPNPGRQAAGGAGVQAAEFLVKQGVGAVVSGAFGPKASDVFRAAKIDMYQASSGTVDELITKLQNGDLTVADGG